MKRLFVFISLLAAVALSVMPLRTTTTAAGVRHQKSGIAEFREPVKVLNVVLKGRYLIVHDDEQMARGEACTYIYETKTGGPDKLVVSFHCTPLARQRVPGFTFRTALSPGANMAELREFQFAGSTEAHLVPSTVDTTKPAVVSLMP